MAKKATKQSKAAKLTARQKKVEQMNKDEAKAKLAGKESYSIADKVFTDLEEAKAYAKEIAAKLPPEKSLAQALKPWNTITRKKKSEPTAAKKPEMVKSVKPKKDKPAKATTYTVMDSRKGKTFGTLKEAKAYEAEQRKKTGDFCEIREGTKKPTHRVVSFTAKNK